MLHDLDLVAELADRLSDGEVIDKLHELLSAHGAKSVHRFKVLEKARERHYLIRFISSERAVKACTALGMDSFGFDCVLVKLPAA